MPVLLQISLISFRRLGLSVGIAIIIRLMRNLFTKLGISSIVPCTFTPSAMVSFLFEDHHPLPIPVLAPFQDFLTFGE